MPDTDKLRRLVRNYTFTATPTSICISDPVTVADLNRVIECTANLFNAFIKEIEED